MVAPKNTSQSEPVLTLFDLCLFEMARQTKFAKSAFVLLSEGSAEEAEHNFFKIDGLLDKGLTVNSRGALEYNVLEKLGFLSKQATEVAKQIDSQDASVAKQGRNFVLYVQKDDGIDPGTTMGARWGSLRIKEVCSRILDGKKNSISNVGDVEIISVSQKGIADLLEFNKKLEEAKKLLPSSGAMNEQPITVEMIAAGREALQQAGFSEGQIKQFVRPLYLKRLEAKKKSLVFA